MQTLGLFASLLTLAACSSAPVASQRSATGVAPKAGESQAAQTPSGGGGSGDATTGPKTTNAALTALVAKHDDCAKQGKSWVPQLDTAKMADSPAGDCGADLVKWCCTLPKIEALFSGTPEELSSHVQPLLDKKFQIYGCSQETADQVKVHLIKYDGAAISYTDLTLAGLLASDGAADAASCKAPDINTALQSTGEAAPAAASGPDSPAAPAAPGAPAPAAPAPAPAGTPAPTPAPAPAPTPAVPVVTFAATINPILTNSCGGSSCHGAGSGLVNYVGQEAGFKGDATKVLGRINGGSMPPAGTKTLSAADKATLVKFLTP